MNKLKNNYQSIEKLYVNKVLYNFVNKELLKKTKIKSKQFIRVFVINFPKLIQQHDYYQKHNRRNLLNNQIYHHSHLMRIIPP